MSITFDIPADVKAGVEGISDLSLRVALYLRREAQLEAVRRQRHSALAREIVAEAAPQAEIEKSAGFDRDESFAQLRQAHQNITERL
jgi:hypothetical protein